MCTPEYQYRHPEGCRENKRPTKLTQKTLETEKNTTRPFRVFSLLPFASLIFHTFVHAEVVAGDGREQHRHGQGNTIAYPNTGIGISNDFQFPSALVFEANSILAPLISTSKRSLKFDLSRKMTESHRNSPILVGFEMNFVPSNSNILINLTENRSKFVHFGWDRIFF